MNMKFITCFFIVCYLLAYDNTVAVSIRRNKIAASGFPGEDSKQWIQSHITNGRTYTVPVGGVVELECEAVGSPPPLTRWFYKNDLLVELGFQEKNELANTAVGKVISRLKFDCAMPHMQGEYTCGAIASSERIVNSANLIIDGGNLTDLSPACLRGYNHIPRIILYGATLMELIGNDVVIPCAADGTPQPEIMWIDNANKFIEKNNLRARRQVLDNGDLYISKLVWEDMGNYVCIAQNKYGRDEATTFLYPVTKGK